MKSYMDLEDLFLKKKKKSAWTCIHVGVQVACSNNYPGAPLKMPITSFSFVMQSLT